MAYASIHSNSMAAILALAPWLCLAADEASTDVAFRVNGEPVTVNAMLQGLAIANECDPKVCATEPAAAWAIRRDRLIRLIPIRQFLAREGLTVPDPEIEARIEEYKASPDPFGSHPPRPLGKLMVREVISWDDLRLMVLTELGMRQWAERAWRNKWPNPETWLEYVRAGTAAFSENQGKFRRLSFTLTRWPKGAANEEEAMAVREREAHAAHARLIAGDAFDTMAAMANATTNSTAPVILPFAKFDANHANALRSLAPGSFSDPFRTTFGWEILRREPLPESDVSAALKTAFVAQTRADAEQRLAQETKIEKVKWEYSSDGLR